tara:strand:+ start:562 stop:921 length:360 start_codon:yes stop_codon:yes gene_type:complete
MIRKSILIYKNWTCSFSAFEYSLRYSDIEIVDSFNGHQELLYALLFYISKKHKSKCKYFRITDDIKNITVVIAKKETKNFLKYLKEISFEVKKYENSETHYKYRNKIKKDGILNNISVN